MRHLKVLGPAGLALVVLLFCCADVKAHQPGLKRIALTFDDAPLASGPLFSGHERTQRLITALRRAEVPQVAFFVTTRNIATQEDQARLRMYAAGGHVLANHSHSHRWLGRTNINDYVADIDYASQKLRSYPKVRPWFRFPFLNESPDEAKRDGIRAALARRKLFNAYVTVDTWDWALVDLVRKAMGAGRKIDFIALRDLYLEVMLSAVATYDGLAMETLGRSPAHVLLAHENDLQALFIEDLVRTLKARGWTIITPDEAYLDRIASEAPDTMLNGNGRVAALAAASGITPHRLRDPFHDEALLSRLFQRRVLLPEGPPPAIPVRGPAKQHIPEHRGAGEP